MTELDKIHMIDASALSGKSYFTSLIEQGGLCGLLSECDIERIGAESVSLLAVQTERYNRGKSSSIRVERAQELLESVFYTVGIGLKGYPSPEDALDAVKREKISVLFARGQAEIRRRIQSAKAVHQRISKELFHTPNVFYRSAAVDGIGGFFKVYRPEFFADKTHITADYPTFLGVPDLCGIEFIEKYLQNIECENRFCLYFSADRVHCLLRGLSEDYHRAVMNIFEPVFTAALCCVLTERQVSELCCDTDALKALFCSKSDSEIADLLSAAAERLSARLSFSAKLREYTKRSISKISATITRAVRYNVLKNVVPIPSYRDKNPKIILDYGARMDDASYTAVLNEIMRCDAADKADVIINRVGSFADLTDILHDAELSKDELLIILRRLGTDVASALASQYPTGEFLTSDSEINIYAALKELFA